MSWESINLSDVAETAAKSNPIPTGDYIFRLLSVTPNKYQEGGLSFDFVVDEGQYKTRRVFPTLPPVNATDTDAWPVQAAKLFMKTLGIEQNAGETVREALNRAATNGHARFAAQVVHDSYTTKAGDPAKKENIRWFSLKPVA